MFNEVRILRDKLLRGIQGSWQVLSVAIAHLKERAVSRQTTSADNEVSALTAAIVSADVVSFDIYDTLLARCIHKPEIVHTAVRLLASDRGLGVPADWERVRRHAESIARSRSTTSDIRYDEIYDLIDVDTALKSALKNLELEVEAAVMRRTDRGFELYAAALASNKRIVVTSDMYLPKQNLLNSLRQGGYGSEELLIVSGDDGVAKQDGSTFVHLAQRFPDLAVLHIGDDRIKDVERAKGSGVDGRLLSRPHPSRERGWAGPSPGKLRAPTPVESLQVSILQGLYEAHVDRERDVGPYEDVRTIGYTILGPLLAGFSDYVDREARRRGANRLIFLAREGAVLQRGYKALKGDASLNSDYGVVSSRLLGLANLSADLNAEDMRFLTKSPIALTGQQFVQRVISDLNGDRSAAVLTAAGVAWGKRVHGREAEIALRPVFETLSSELAELSQRAKRPLTQYLQALGLEDPRTLVVDTGWVGTLQTAMGEMLGKAVGGVYVGVHSTSASRSRPNMSGWVDGRQGGEASAMLRTLYAHVQPLEVLLANPSVGSVVGIDGNHAGGDSFTFSYLESEFAAKAQASIRQMQDAAVTFITDWKGAVTGLSESTKSLSVRPAIGPTIQLMTRPSLAQYRALGQLPFDGTYGVRPTVLGRWWVPDQFRRHL